MKGPFRRRYGDESESGTKPSSPTWFRTLSICRDLSDWTEISRMKSILKEYAMFLSPDKTKTAVTRLEDGAIVSVYNRTKKKMEYISPQLREGINLIHDLLANKDSRNQNSLKRETIEFMIRKGIKCAHCKIAYIDFKDFIERNPRRGYDLDLFVDSFCWEPYDSQKKMGI